MFRILLLSAIIGLVTTTMTASVKVEKTEYKGWPTCHRVSNGEIDLIVTGDVGPRVIRFGFVGGQNLFKEFPDQLGRSGEERSQLRGGDRVWKAPEDPVATWAPDNEPVTNPGYKDRAHSSRADRTVNQPWVSERGCVRQFNSSSRFRISSPRILRPLSFVHGLCSGFSEGTTGSISSSKQSQLPMWQW
jgi:hypothetical protein